MSASAGDSDGDRTVWADPRFKRGGLAAIVAYVVGLFVHTAYIVATANFPYPGRVISDSPVYFLDIAVGSYEGSHLGSALYIPGFQFTDYYRLISVDPYRFLVPVAVLVAAGWYVTDRTPGTPTRDTHLRIVAGAVVAYLGLTTFAGFYLPGPGVLYPPFWWKLAVVGLVYPALFSTVGVLLHDARGRRSVTTGRSHPGRPTEEDARVGSTVPAAEELACPECGERAGRGTFGPHCGADL